MLLAFVATAVHSQESNQQLRQLEKYLQEQGFSVGHVQSSGHEEKGVTHQFRALLYVFGVNPESMYDSTLTAEQNQLRVHVADSINKQRQKRMLDAVDSIRLCFARLGKDASESYLYEFHKNGTDTIKYSLSFKKETTHSILIDVAMRSISTMLARLPILIMFVRIVLMEGVRRNVETITISTLFPPILRGRACVRLTMLRSRNGLLLC